MHRYVVAFETLGIKAGDRITSLSLSPKARHMLGKPMRCEIGRIGLLAAGARTAGSTDDNKHGELKP